MIDFSDVRLVIEDFDSAVSGTIEETYWVAAQFLREAINPSYKLTFADFLKTFRQPLVNFFRQRGVRGTRWPKREVVRRCRYWEEYYRRHLVQPELCPGVHEALTHLEARGTPVVVISAQSTEWVQRGLESFDLEQSFSRIISNTGSKVEAIQRCCAEARCHPSQALYLGGLGPDITGGLLAGVQVVGVTLFPQIMTEVLARAGASIVISDHRDLIPCLRAA